MKKRYVKVQFEGTERLYGYSSFDETLEVGDTVLVDSCGSYALPVVVEIKDMTELNGNEIEVCKKYDIKQILAKVDLSAYKKGLEFETRQKELMKRIEQRYSQVSEMAKYKLMAENDEEMRKLIAELETL